MTDENNNSTHENADPAGAPHAGAAPYPSDISYAGAASYPSDTPYVSRASYPSDTPYVSPGSYSREMTYHQGVSAADSENDNPSGGEENEPSSAAKPKGKGKRGGNAASSRVIHSGKPEIRKNKREERKKEDGRKSGPRERREGRGDTAYRRGNEWERTGTSARRAEKGKAQVFSKAYVLKVESVSEVGAFVSAPDEVASGAWGEKIAERVLLPFAEQVGRPGAGDKVTVRFYEDKGGRLTCTMRTPYLNDGELGRLKVSAVTKIGAFLDNGVPKEVLLPFREQISEPKIGHEVLVWMYTDKSGRQAATMRIYSHLDSHSPYKEDDRVSGFVYEINPRLGIFVAVDDKYFGLVPVNETFKRYEYGDEISARVARVRNDGKLDLLIRDKLFKTTEEDSEVILYELRRNNGFLPYGDRAEAKFIEETYAMSKNQFKRALGHLYRNRIVELDRQNDTVTLIAKDR